MSALQGTLPVVVKEIIQATPLIKTFVLASPDGSYLPAFSGGSHIGVVLRKGDITYRNPYSLMSSPYDSSCYQIGVRRVEDGRGGSKMLHDEVNVGDILEITRPVNLFPLNLHARKHILIAGGIGITPFFSMLEELRKKSVPFELHAAARDEANAALLRELQAKYGDHVKIYLDSLDQRLSLKNLLADQPLGSHLYVCGPATMIDATVSEAHAAGWTDSHIHFERFAEQITGNPFEVTLAKSGKTLQVPPEMSLLEVLEASEVDIPYLCRGGACGHCETEVLELEGSIQHNDVWLSDEEKAANQKIMPCVSRGICSKLVINL